MQYLEGVKIVSAIRNYTQPRIDRAKGVDTSGDIPELRPGAGVLAGGIQGYLLDGISGAAGGVVGSYAGIAAKNKTQSMLVGAAVGTSAGALTSTALSAGLEMAFTGGVSPQLMAMSAFAGGVSGLAGTLSSTTGGNGVLTGGIQGFVGNRASGMTAGSLGAFAGAEVGKLTGSTTAALLAGSSTGAALGVGTTAGLVSILGGRTDSAMLVGSAVLGGLAGAVGTLSASRRAAPQDGAYGGMAAGMAAGSIVGNPALGVATAAAGSFASRANTTAGQVMLGVAGGAATGALVGSLQGPAGILTGALAGAVAAPVGAVVGTTSRQVMRNAQVDLVDKINSKYVDPYLEKKELSRGQKLAVGAAAGGLMLGTTGMVAGWKGVAAMGTVGAAAGAFQTDRMIAKAKEHRDSVSNASTHSRPSEVFADVLAAQSRISAGA